MRYPFKDDDLTGYLSRSAYFMEEFKDNIDDTIYEVRFWKEHKEFECDLYWKRAIFMSKLTIAIFGESDENKRFSSSYLESP